MNKPIPSVFQAITARWISALVILLLWVGTAEAQTKKQLEDQRNKLIEQIGFIKKQIEEVQKKKETSVNQLVSLRKQIQVRERLIENFNNDIGLTQNQIDGLEVLIIALENDLAKLKTEYGKMLQVAYRNRSHYNNVILVLSAENFNQALRRLRYLQQYNSFRQTQVRLINQTQASLNKRKAQLEQKRQEKEMLLREEETQKSLLSYESEKTTQIVSKLQQNERDLRKELQAQEAARVRLQRAIEDIIRRELEEARRQEAERLKKQGQKPGQVSAPKTTREEFELTPEAKALGADFEANKGKLPWPISKGFVSESFGEHPHPVLKNVKVRNDGINLRTAQGAEVKAVFRGEVTAVVSIPGMQKAVIVRHGQYLTVYAHIEDVRVSKGSKIETGQVLGTVYFDDAENKAEMQLQVWRGTTKIDPQPWLARR
ncbi:MAG: peptidase M23 [Sphingobacteriaceae bacterium]|nr:peptidase M23 [Sphingobacteriaceae bacterium]